MWKKSIAAVLLAFSVAAWAQETVQVIDLQDGGKVLIQKDGTTVHVDAAGNRVRMRDGVVMTAKDGTKVMMKNNAIWRQITEHGTLKPGH